MTYQERVIVLIASRRQPRAETLSALQSNMDGVSHVVVGVSGLPVVDARNHLATKAIELSRDASYRFALFIDDDAWWRSGTLTTMLRAMREYPAIGVLLGYFSARGPNLPANAAFRWWACDHYARKWCYNHPAALTSNVPKRLANCMAGEIVHVERSSLHFALVRLPLLKRIGQTPFDVPCYEMAPGAEVRITPEYGFPNNAVLTEDFAFCDRVVEAESTIAVATGCPIVHIGRGEHDGWGYYPMAPPIPPGMFHQLPHPFYTSMPRAAIGNSPRRGAPQEKGFWYGGMPGLKTGDMLVREPIYITPFRDEALYFARCYAGGGAVYEVEPAGEITHEIAEGKAIVHHKVSRARVIEVVTPRVSPNELGVITAVICAEQFTPSPNR